jgi:hypothetical protein
MYCNVSQLSHGVTTVTSGQCLGDGLMRCVEYKCIIHSEEGRRETTHLTMVEAMSAMNQALDGSALFVEVISVTTERVAYKRTAT